MPDILQQAAKAQIINKINLGKIICHRFSRVQIEEAIEVPQ